MDDKLLLQVQSLFGQTNHEVIELHAQMHYAFPFLFSLSFQELFNELSKFDYELLDSCLRTKSSRFIVTFYSIDQEQFRKSILDYGYKEGKTLELSAADSSWRTGSRVLRKADPPGIYEMNSSRQNPHSLLLSMPYIDDDGDLCPQTEKFLPFSTEFGWVIDSYDDQWLVKLSEARTSSAINQTRLERFYEFHRRAGLILDELFCLFRNKQFVLSKEKKQYLAISSHDLMVLVNDNGIQRREEELLSLFMPERYFSYRQICETTSSELKKFKAIVRSHRIDEDRKEIIDRICADSINFMKYLEAMEAAKKDIFEKALKLISDFEAELNGYRLIKTLSKQNATH